MRIFSRVDMTLLQPPPQIANGSLLVLEQRAFDYVSEQRLAEARAILPVALATVLARHAPAAEPVLD